MNKVPRCAGILHAGPNGSQDQVDPFPSRTALALHSPSRSPSVSRLRHLELV